MDVLILMLLGAAARADVNGHEILVHRGIVYVDKQQVGTLDLEPFDRKTLESEPQLAGKKYITTFQVDGRKAARAIGLSDQEVQEAELPQWMDGQLRLGEAWETPDGEYLIWQPTGSDAMRISTGSVEVCRCSDDSAPQTQCDPNDCNGDCGAGGPGHVCRWVKSSGGGCTTAAAMIVPLAAPLMMMRRRRHARES